MCIRDSYQDVTFAGTASVETGQTIVAGEISNSGTLTFEGDTSTTADETLLISGGVSLSGGGQVVLVDNDSVIGNAAPFIGGTAGVLTNVDNTIRGQGTVGVQLTNESLVRAEGGTLTLGAATDNSAGNIEIAADGRLQNSVSITGGTITAEAGSKLASGLGVYQDVTFAGTASVETGQTIVAGEISNSGMLTFEGDTSTGTDENLLISGATSLSGGGQVVLVDNDSVIGNAAPFIGGETGVLTNVDNTIRGTGRIQNITIENQGTIRAEGGELTFTGVDFTQTAGRLEVAEDGVLRASQELLILDGQVGGTGIIIGDIRNQGGTINAGDLLGTCLLYTSPSPRDRTRSRMPSSA